MLGTGYVISTAALNAVSTKACITDCRQRTVCNFIHIFKSQQLLSWNARFRTKPGQSVFNVCSRTSRCSANAISDAESFGLMPIEISKWRITIATALSMSAVHTSLIASLINLYPHQAVVRMKHNTIGFENNSGERWQQAPLHPSVFFPLCIVCRCLKVIFEKSKRGGSLAKCFEIHPSPRRQLRCLSRSVSVRESYMLHSLPQQKFEKCVASELKDRWPIQWTPVSQRIWDPSNNTTSKSSTNVGCAMVLVLNKAFLICFMRAERALAKTASAISSYFACSTYKFS